MSVCYHSSSSPGCVVATCAGVVRGLVVSLCVCVIVLGSVVVASVGSVAVLVIDYDILWRVSVTNRRVVVPYCCSGLWCPPQGSPPLCSHVSFALVTFVSVFLAGASSSA